MTFTLNVQPLSGELCSTSFMVYYFKCEPGLAQFITHIIFDTAGHVHHISNVTESVYALDFSVVYPKSTTIVVMDAHRFDFFDVYFQENCLRKSYELICKNT